MMILFRYVVWVACLTISLSLIGCGKKRPKISRTAPKPPSPVAVAVSSVGYIYYSRISVDVRGNGSASGFHPYEDRSGDASHSFKITKSQQEQLSRLVDSTKFFQLGAEYGDNVPDGGVDRIRISRGKKAKMVTLLYLGNWEREKNPKLNDAKKVLEIWDLVQGWITPPKKSKAGFTRKISK
jgi:hypothetical protein